jgi:hypothetical protein
MLCVNFSMRFASGYFRSLSPSIGISAPNLIGDVPLICSNFLESMAVDDAPDVTEQLTPECVNSVFVTSGVVTALRYF